MAHFQFFKFRKGLYEGKEGLQICTAWAGENPI
jgi:hypothetical protein